MIRGFDLLCKINFNHYSVIELFKHFMLVINVHDYPCAKCGAHHPNWKKHGFYPRFLIGFHQEKVICEIVFITRYKCQSCFSTHAFLPEFLVPFKSHSLLFILAALKDRFIGGLTISQICAKYEISANTFYAWQKAFLRDKKLWLGILEDLLTSIPRFLSFLVEDGLKNLEDFFLSSGHSLFQTQVKFLKNCIFTPD